MKKCLKELMMKACVAAPPETKMKSGWGQYLPILRILMEERGYTLMAAVRWLVQQGEIPLNRQMAAYSALRYLRLRRETRRMRQLLREQMRLQVARKAEKAAAKKPASASSTLALKPATRTATPV